MTTPFLLTRKFATIGEKGHRKTPHGHVSTSQLLSRKRITAGTNGGLINEISLKSLDFKRDYLFPFSLLLHNTRPVGREVLMKSSLYDWVCILYLACNDWFAF